MDVMDGFKLETVGPTFSSWTIYLQTQNIIPDKIGQSEFQILSLLKLDQVQNLSCENEFYLHDTKKSFPYQELGT